MLSSFVFLVVLVCFVLFCFVFVKTREKKTLKRGSFLSTRQETKEKTIPSKIDLFVVRKRKRKRREEEEEEKWVVEQSTRDFSAIFRALKNPVYT